MQKTVKEWLETIEDKEVRERALSQCTRLYESASSLAEAVFHLHWKKTEEGADYWYEVYDNARIV